MDLHEHAQIFTEYNLDFISHSHTPMSDYSQ
jgi:hypothetical protein